MSSKTFTSKWTHLFDFGCFPNQGGWNQEKPISVWIHCFEPEPTQKLKVQPRAIKSNQPNYPRQKPKILTGPGSGLISFSEIRFFLHVSFPSHSIRLPIRSRDRRPTRIVQFSHLGFRIIGSNPVAHRFGFGFTLPTSYSGLFFFLSHNPLLLTLSDYPIRLSKEETSIQQFSVRPNSNYDSIMVLLSCFMLLLSLGLCFSCNLWRLMADFCAPSISVFGVNPRWICITSAGNFIWCLVFHQNVISSFMDFPFLLKNREFLVVYLALVLFSIIILIDFSRENAQTTWGF